MTDRIRLNGAKRSLLKKGHWGVNLQTPCEQKDNLIDAQTRFFSTQTDVHEICKKLVEERFPKADRDVMRKYNSDASYHTTFTTMDACFVLKNVERDEEENRIDFALSNDVSVALNHDKMIANGLNPFVECQSHIAGGANNPQINTDRSANATWLNDNFNQLKGYGYAKRNPFALEVVNTGSCHSRAYAIQNWQHEFVLNFEQAKVELIQCHRKYYEYCKTNQDTMCTVIDQAKYLDEVQEYWSDIDKSILVNGDSLSTNLAVVSEDRLEQLKAMANNRKVLTPIIKVQQQNQA
tara:strand:- start:30 stop:911 length:882 start_codon:yes stop_codon:yes gene_type:complete